MTIELIESGDWPSLRRKIEAKRTEYVDGLLRVTPEALRGEQQFIAALDWVLEEAKPPMPDDREPIYGD
jgi:acyl-CoA hydrolase